MKTLLSLSLILILVGCGSGSTPGTSFLSATVVPLEGGSSYGLLGDDGVAYEPTNLPPQFKIDGMRVRCDARVLDGEGDWGKPIEIVDVERIDEPAPGRDILFEGTVNWVDLEGGFWGILGDDGKKYDPVNLPGEFAVDGLRVVVAARVLEDGVHFHMWGELIVIENIDLAETPGSVAVR
ncbi:MAG: hypothetical protein ACYTGZ_19485 [Planctomycetota bacterium]|jgi:hypothetical protein